MDGLVSTRNDDPDGVADAADYDIEALHAAVTADRELLASFAMRVKDLHEGTDPKVEALIDELAAMAADAAAEGIGPQETRDKRKTLVFTYFADAATYLEGARRNAINSDPDDAHLCWLSTDFATSRGPGRCCTSV